MQRAQKMLKDNKHFSKQRDKVFDIKKLNLLKLPAHLDTGNQHNCNKMCAMFSLFTEFITEFESTWGIVVKQFFAEGKGEIIE